MDIIADIIRQVAAQEIMPRFKNLTEGDISAKSPGDMVTVADLAAEKALTKEVLRLYPEAMVCGEESIAQNPALLEAAIVADRAFLIDPIDGTNNFITGDTRFAVMLVELHKGEAVAARIYLPALEKMAMAEKGAGAHLNDVAFKISSPQTDHNKMIAAAHINRFPKDVRAAAVNNLNVFKENKPAFCAGYDYISLIEGAKDFSLYYRTLPWDHLPGSLIFSEAGGYVRTLIGEKEYGIHDRKKGLLSAANKAQWQNIRAAIFPEFC